MSALSQFRYLTFEINETCALADLHPRCPVSDPDRYTFGNRVHVLDDDTVLRFWRWACALGFEGILLWHLYNEPMTSVPRIKALVQSMRAERPSQRTHLWSSLPSAKRLDVFDHVVHTDYRVVMPEQLDSRRAAAASDGDYRRAMTNGWCGRAKDFELIIDHRGNWLKCCADWRCEGSFGNVYVDAWDVILERYQASAQVRWRDVRTFEALPRMCRGCVTENPMLHRSAMPPPGRDTWE